MTKSVKMYIIHTKLNWILLKGKGLKTTELSELAGISRMTLYRWRKRYEKYGEFGLLDRPRRPKTCPKAIPNHIVEKVKEIRIETRFGPDKIVLRLKKKYGVSVTVRSCARIIKRLGLTRKRRRIPMKPKFQKKHAAEPGELIQVDVKYAQRFNRRWVCQFTAIDDFTRFRFTKFYEEQSNYHAIDFLKSTIAFFPFRIKAIKTDNASIFTNRYTGYQKSIDPLHPKFHALDQFCLQNQIIHYLIDPGKPAQNGKVERSHRTDQEEFYDRNGFVSFRDLKKKAKTFLDYYNNDREHLGIDGLTPVEKLRNFQ